MTKQKDLEQGQRFPFRLVPLIVGTNERGKEVTSCRVEHLNESEAPLKRKGGRTAKNIPCDLLPLLPQATIASWENAANDELGIPHKRFYNLKKELSEGLDYAKSETGEIIAPGGDIFDESRN